MKSELILGEVGMNIIDINTHYTLSQGPRDLIKKLIWSEHGIEADDDIIEVFLQNEESSHPAYDNSDINDKLGHLMDEAYFMGEGDNSHPYLSWI